MNEKPMDILKRIVFELRGMATVMYDDSNINSAVKLKEFANNIENTFFKERDKKRVEPEYEGGITYDSGINN